MVSWLIMFYLDAWNYSLNQELSRITTNLQAASYCLYLNGLLVACRGFLIEITAWRWLRHLCLCMERWADIHAKKKEWWSWLWFPQDLRFMLLLFYKNKSIWIRISVWTHSLTWTSKLNRNDWVDDLMWSDCRVPCCTNYHINKNTNFLRTE